MSINNEIGNENDNNYDEYDYEDYQNCEDSVQEMKDFILGTNQNDEMRKYSRKLLLSGGLTSLGAMLTFFSLGNIKTQDLCLYSLMVTILAGAISYKNHVKYSDAKEKYEIENKKNIKQNSKLPDDFITLEKMKEIMKEKDNINKNGTKVIKFPKNNPDSTKK